MCKYFSIDGYWKDDQTEFSDYIVKEYDETEETEERDNMIFNYGLSENEIKDAIASPDGNGLAFVITSYKEINF